MRALSGGGVVLCVLGGVIWGGRVWFAIACVAALLSLSEYYKLLASQASQVRVSRGIGYVSAIAVMLAASGRPRPISIAMILSLAVFAVFMVEIVRRQTSGVSRAVSNAGGTVSGILFVVVPWACLVMLGSLPTGRLVLFSLFACTWSCDVAAYLIGAAWGRYLLCDKVSPKKTWEGFIGGALGSILMIALIIFYRDQPPFPLLTVGVICALAGQFGDLAESLLKRECGAKDSGRLIPGHGGMLDRFDSVLVNGLLTYMVFGAVGSV
jgi:phosphatidate cytidylyltransferase